MMSNDKSFLVNDAADLLADALAQCFVSTKHGPLQEPDSLGDAVAVVL